MADDGAHAIQGTGQAGSQIPRHAVNDCQPVKPLFSTWLLPNGCEHHDGFNWPTRVMFLKTLTLDPFYWAWLVQCWLKLAIVCLTGGRWLWLKRRLTIAVLQSCKTLDKVARRQSILSWRGLPGSVWPCLAPLPLLIIAWRHLLIRNCWQDGEMWGLVYWFLVQAHRRLPCCTGDSRGLITAAPFKL